MSRIPKVLHYCFGFSADFGGKPWSLVHYACLRSAIERINPGSAFLYFEFEPSGPWWDLSKRLVDTVKIRAPREIFGNPVAHVAHRADVVRLEKLIECGGIYLDCDVFVHRPFDDLLDDAFVISEEGVGAAHGLSNAILLSEPSAAFARRWYEGYRSFRGGTHWVEHSLELPLQLARRHPAEVRVLPHTAFCWPLHNEEHLKWIFEAGQAKLDHGPYANHLWEGAAWERYLKGLTPRRVRETKSNFNAWVAPFVAALPDDYGAPGLLEALGQTAFAEMRRAKRSLLKRFPGKRS